ncbi:DNA/RNA non-specific endonuclease [Paludisphaera rhizosphaerae]|uniref:DNA/RNA non-specific endonuclease n=1 Tax=Paludisphaera rhizosphaerae TaxID=2711216 RepID=UPI0013EB0552|nr:DNA/RNA non-specific endonuclease [Paludisphaera rhizosphaerae]
MSTPRVPERIASAAKSRMDEQEARKQRDKVLKATESGKPLSAEPDAERKIKRFSAVAHVSEERAKTLVRGTAPERLGLAGEVALGAERIQGKTTDFVGVSFLDRARAASGSVARVISRDGSPIGSGFMVSDRLFLTNNHVLLSEADAAGMLLEFNYELDIQGRTRIVTRFEIDSRAFFVTNLEDDLDFTLVAVGRRESGPNSLADFGYCPILDSDDKHILGEFVNIIEHPDGDFKQVVLRENQLVTRLETVLHYMADTSPGSSGSPVFNDQWEAVALHHYGEPFRQTVDQDGKPIDRQLNEGIRISAIVKALGDVRRGLSDAQRGILDTALNTSERGPSRADDIADLLSGTGQSNRNDDSTSNEREPAPMNGGDARSNADGSVTLTVPLEITVRLGGAGYSARVTPNEPTTSSAERKPPPDSDYSNRKGYDPNFLPGFVVPFPAITDDAPGTPARLSRTSRNEDPTILKYEHFSIVINADRKMAFVTAVNIDGALSRSVNRDTGKAKPGFERFVVEAAPESAEATEKWYEDPRIPAGVQTTQALYDNQRPRVFDRGHMVRREDPNWGTDESAERANADTFHFANCCPQASPFNQQARFWQGIENFVLDNARSEDAKVSVFTGPVFARNDPRYRDVRVPVQFYKIVAHVDGGELRAIAMLASQADFLNRLPERIGGERFDDLGDVEQYQTTVAEIEELTGIDFGPLRDADVFGDRESLGSPLRLLRSFDDLVLNGRPERRPASRRRY